MLLHSIKLTNFLSYGPESSELPLRNLNVIIGTNASSLPFFSINMNMDIPLIPRSKYG